MPAGIWSFFPAGVQERLLVGNHRFGLQLEAVRLPLVQIQIPGGRGRLLRGVDDLDAAAQANTVERTDQVAADLHIAGICAVSSLSQPSGFAAQIGELVAVGEGPGRGVQPPPVRACRSSRSLSSAVK
ncbi:hypothetical protein [Streptomyces sp. BBFR102]|uniref:hypothetical protein n=1 Tax=Streptomyces sp. BBFR102 TaxID=3448171 RepID=UPI003F53435F